MGKFSDRHHQRLHTGQGASFRSEQAAAATVPPLIAEQRDALTAADDPASIGQAASIEADSELRSSPPTDSPEKKQRPKSVKNKRGKSEQTPSSRHLMSNRKLMNYFRHTLALAILVTFGYLYTQQRQAETDDHSSASAEPFSDWKDIAQAPAFDANTVSLSQQGTPDPISISHEDDTELGGIPAGLANWIESGNEKSPEQPTTNEVADVQTSTSKISKLKERSLSLWDEPVPAEGDDQEEAEREVESIASTSGIDDLSEETSYQSSNQLQNQGKQNIRGMMESWREFRLGSGNQTTVCVVDQTVSRDTLLLSTIFAGIRSEWFNDVSRSRQQSLVMLIANQQVTKGISGKYFARQTPSTEQKQQELQRKIRAVAPSRIVYISRGNDERGRIKFTSEEESIAALMSVPGMFRITTSKQDTYYSPGQPEQVHIELPAQSQAEETATAGLLFTALTGEWGSGQQQASRDSYGTQQEEKTNFQDLLSGESQFEESQQAPSGRPHQSKRRVEMLPSPSAYRQQAKAKQNGTRNSFFKLPPPPVQREN